MPARRDDKKSLKIVEEDSSDEEDVLRLKGGSAEAERVARIQKAPEPEQATRIGGLAPEVDRRSQEPDIDVIIDSPDTAPDPETFWSKDGRAKPAPYGWFVLILLIVGLAVVASTMLGPEEAVSETDIAREASVEKIEENQVADAEAREVVEAAEETLAKYLAVGSVEELLPLVRQRERVEPLIRDWYSRHPFQPQTFERLTRFSSVNIARHSFWQTVSMVEEGGTAIVLLEELPDAKILVDWETSVRYQPMDWEAFVQDRPEVERLEFRVLAEPDLAGLYAHEFSNEDLWRGFVLSTRDSPEYLIGYASRGTPLEKNLIEAYRRNGWKPVALVLSLSRPAGTQSPRGVVIEDLISPHWVIAERRSERSEK